MSSTVWKVPPHIQDIIEEIPTDVSVAVLLRHSVRPPLPAQGHGNDLELTEAGYRIADELGAIFGQRLQSLHSSPVKRCIQTAEALCAGAHKNLKVRQDRLLGDPGIFILDVTLAGPYWLEHGPKKTIIDMMRLDTPLPGMAVPSEAAISLVNHMLKTSDDTPGYHVFVSHDSIQMVTASRLFSETLEDHHWPWFLDGIFCWSDGESVCFAYKGLRAATPEPYTGNIVK